MNYPNKITKSNNSVVSHSNRGMDLEHLLNLSNQTYLEKNRALIYKKPTDIGVVKVSYSNRSKRINDGFFKTPSTLDYNGLYRGKYIEFDAKVTKKVTSFPLSNIHPHQIIHIKKVLEHDGIAFLVIKIHDNYLLLKGEDLIGFINNTTRKSIPFSYLMEYGYQIKEKIDPPLDYLEVVDHIYFGGKE